MQLTSSQLLQTEKYSPEGIRNAAIIMHPKFKGYNITADELMMVFEEGCNFTQLQNPISDEYGNIFWDTEGYYMAARTNDTEIKKMIAFMSTGYGLARKSRKNFKLEQDLVKRIEYMRKAVRLKFDMNPGLRQKLLDTGDKLIIEYTFWNDILFGIDQNTLQGCNVLGKLLMEYRDNLIGCLK